MVWRCQERFTDISPMIVGHRRIIEPQEVFITLRWLTARPQRCDVDTTLVAILTLLQLTTLMHSPETMDMDETDRVDS